MSRFLALCRRLHQAARRATLAARIAYTAAQLRWVADDADRLANDMRQLPRQLALWRGIEADLTIRLHRLIAQQHSR